MVRKPLYALVGAAAGIILALRLGGPWPAALAAGIVALYSPVASSVFLLAYTAASPLWKAKPGFLEALVSLAPLVPAAGPWGIAAIAAGVVVVWYTLLLLNALLSPRAYPPPMRIVLEHIVTDPVVRLAAYVVAALAALMAMRRVAGVAAAAASPRLAAEAVREWVRREAEAVRHARAWYHRLLSWSLGLLASLPPTFIVNAFVAALYSALAVYAPNAWVRDALQFARGVISAGVLWGVAWVTSRSISRMLSGEWTPAPGRLAPVALIVFAVAVAAAASLDPTYPIRVAACALARCPPAALQPTPLDARIEAAIRATGEMLEASEAMLRFLVRLLWR